VLAVREARVVMAEMAEVLQAVRTLPVLVVRLSAMLRPLAEQLMSAA
jgi:hypothetical protein